MTDKTYRMDGDLHVTGDSLLDGDVNVKGGAAFKEDAVFKRKVTIAKDLKVLGWLDAPNIRGCGKGLFLSREELIAAYPRPHRGWWAVVSDELDGAGAEGTLFVCTLDEYQRPVWTDTGKTVSLDGLLNVVEPLEKEIEDLRDEIADQADALEKEQEHVTSLQDALSDTKDALEALDGEVVKDVTASGAGALNLQAARTAGDKVEITGSVAEVTNEESGLMTPEQRRRLQAITRAIVYFDSIVDDTVPVLHVGTCAGDDIASVDFYVNANAFYAKGVDGYRYGTWEADGKKYMGSDDYMASNGYPLLKLFISGSTGFIFDSYLGVLAALGDMSRYVSWNDTASEDKDGLMSAADKLHLDFVYDAISTGRISNGTARFNGIKCMEGDSTACFVAEGEPEWYDGICWLKDKKMFCAYQDYLIVNNIAYVQMTYYAHWDTERFLMERPGEERGLWKDKVYIYGGAVYVWANCDDDLVKTSGKGEYVIITNEEIDEAMEDFEFAEVTEGTTGGIVDVSAKGADPLTLTATKYSTTAGNEVRIDGAVDIDAIDTDDIGKLF